MTYGNRHRICALCAAVVAAALLMGAAQDPAAVQPPAQPATQGSTTPPAGAQPAVKETPPGKDPTQGSGLSVEDGSGKVADDYSVKEGDTLWDISSRHLNNPWYWPKLWSYNPQITNPHWIYPGETVRFYPSGEEMPYQVDGKEHPAVSKGDVSGVGLEIPDDIEGVQVSGKINKLDGLTAYVRRDSFVSSREVERAGELFASFDEKMMLSVYDRAYFRFKDANNVRIGDRYMVYEEPSPVYYPESKKIAGYRVEIAGGFQVVKIDKDVVTAQSFVAYRPIYRGYHALPWVDDNYRKIRPKSAIAAVTGLILETAIDERKLTGEHQMVFVDKGRDDGVVEGNIFFVTRRGDSLPSPVGAFSEYAKFKGLPWEDVGAVIIVDARDKVSTGLVAQSIRELVVGDRLETRLTTK